MISLTIMTHPKRENIAIELFDKINKIKPDFVSKVDLVIDREHNLWKNTINACNVSDEYHIVLQDDISIPDNFFYLVKKAIIEKPNTPICFYSNSPTIKRAIDSKKSWVISTHTFRTPGFMAPKEYIKKFLEWSIKSTNDNPHKSDCRFTLFNYLFGIRTYYTVPCIIQHVGHDSLIGNKGARSGEHYYIDEKEFIIDDSYMYLSPEWPIDRVANMVCDLKIIDSDYGILNPFADNELLIKDNYYRLNKIKSHKASPYKKRRRFKRGALTAKGLVY